MNVSGFREIEHTADWQIEVWAPDFVQLVEQASRGMYALIQPQNGLSEPVEKSFTIDAPDYETILVRFLNELLFYLEHERLVINEYHLSLDGLKLSARLKGARVCLVGKEIKAVTWHNLGILRENNQLRIRIVFDV
jgi:SHS2 domain-containing protein